MKITKPKYKIGDVVVIAPNQYEYARQGTITWARYYDGCWNYAIGTHGHSMKRWDWIPESEILSKLN